MESEALCARAFAGQFGRLGPQPRLDERDE